MTPRIVVLGAGYAGLTAARRLLRRKLPVASVTVVNQSRQFVERIRLHQVATGQQIPAAAIDVPDLVVGTATHLDLEHRYVQVEQRRVDYDILVYALGSDTDRARVRGVREHAYTLGSVVEAERLARRLAELPPAAEVLVIGGGLTGIEAATEIAHRRPDLRVSLASAGGAGHWLSPRARSHLRRALGELGVTMHEQTPVVAVEPTGALAAGGRQISAAVVVWAAGFRVSRLARDAGLAVDDHDRMVVDDHLRSVSHPEVYGVGDAAALPARGGGVSRMACQTGLPMGAYAARDIRRRLEGRPTRPLRVRYVWQNISLGRDDAITQFTRSDDSPVDTVLTGRPAARFKELITRSAAWTAHR